MKPNETKAAHRDGTTAGEIPLAQRITQGRVTRRDKTSQPVHIHNVEEPSKTIANVYGNSATIEANAELIAEAFNVTHETGKAPAQLAAENAALREALESAELSTVQIRMGGADIGRTSAARREAWFRSQLAQLGQEIRETLDSVKP